MQTAEVDRTPVSVRELRAGLAGFMKGDRPRIIGNAYEARAIIVPIPYHRRWDQKERAKAFRAAKKAFNELLASMT